LGPQAVPQPPQLLGSVSVLTHAPPHLAKPALHTKSQTMAAQVATLFAGAEQAFPHLPQLSGSCAKSTQLLPHLP
jgi:hypothetical protein